MSGRTPSGPLVAIPTTNLDLLHNLQRLAVVVIHPKRPASRLAFVADDAAYPEGP